MRFFESFGNRPTNFVLKDSLFVANCTDAIFLSSMSILTDFILFRSWTSVTSIVRGKRLTEYDFFNRWLPRDVIYHRRVPLFGHGGRLFTENDLSTPLASELESYRYYETNRKLPRNTTPPTGFGISLSTATIYIKILESLWVYFNRTNRLLFFDHMNIFDVLWVRRLFR